MTEETQSCSNTRCARTKSLWYRKDTDEWFCWPHFRLTKRGGQYMGRKRHHDFAVTASRELHPTYMQCYDGGVTYAGDEHYEHRAFALWALEVMGKPANDRHIEWLKALVWAGRALEEEKE